MAHKDSNFTQAIDGASESAAKFKSDCDIKKEPSSFYQQNLVETTILSPESLRKTEKDERLNNERNVQDSRRDSSLETNIISNSIAKEMPNSSSTANNKLCNSTTHTANSTKVPFDDEINKEDTLNSIKHPITSEQYNVTNSNNSDLIQERIDDKLRKNKFDEGRQMEKSTEHSIANSDEVANTTKAVNNSTNFDENDTRRHTCDFDKKEPENQIITLDNSRISLEKLSIATENIGFREDIVHSTDDANSIESTHAKSIENTNLSDDRNDETTNLLSNKQNCSSIGIGFEDIANAVSKDAEYTATNKSLQDVTNITIPEENQILLSKENYSPKDIKVNEFNDRLRKDGQMQGRDNNESNAKKQLETDSYYSTQKEGTEYPNTTPAKARRAHLELHLNEKNQSKIYENPIENEVSDHETDLLLGTKSSNPISITSSNNEERLHVKFGNGTATHLGVKPEASNSSSNMSSSSSSSSSSEESIEITEARPPDGGWGWVVVAASFVVNLIADGITFSFGVIFVEFLSYFGENRGKTAWIGSLFMAMPLLSGPIASFLTDRYGCRKVTIAGSILACAGFVLSSMASNIKVLFLTFGVFAGFGLSLCYVASVVIVAYYFDSKRSLATGLAVCGSGIGTFIFAPLISLLLKEYGWRGTTLILAGLFLNLAVCGALMRDLPWTSKKQKKRAKERKRNRSMKRKKNESSADTFSVSNSTNTASVLQPILEIDEKKDSSERLCSSLVHLPTFVKNGEKVPMEVIELLSTHKNVYDVVMQTYPNLLTPSRSFSDSGRLNELHLHQQKFVPTPSPLAAPPTVLTAETFDSSSKHKTDAAYIWWLKRNFSPPRLIPQKKIPPAYLKDLRVHRLSLTYRGAMLNINRYRLRASSCPDIYRNSMTTIAKEKSEWYLAFWDFWDVVADMFDFSHFYEPKFLLFALSNFLLYTWYDIPYVYLTDNALAMGYTEEQSSFLIAIIGIINMFGEIILGWAGDRERWNAGLIYAVCMAFCGAATAVIPFITDYVSMLFASGAFGLFIAANYSLTCVILVEIITLERFTNAYGLLLLVQGVANLIGPPLGGLLYDITGTYDLSFYLAGIFITLSGLMLCVLPATKRFRKFHTIQRQISCEKSIRAGTKPKEPKVYRVLASCITGRVKKHETDLENHV